MKRGRALYRIEKNGVTFPYGRFYSWDHAHDFLKKLLKGNINWDQYLIIDDNNIPF